MTGSETNLTDDILVAFADQQLSLDEMARLRPLIEADPIARQKVKEFEDSAEQLKTLLGTNVDDVTPDHIAATIRAMPLPETSSADSNVISLSGYKAKMARAFQTLSASNGLQKVAASLVIGAFVGVGAGQYADLNLDGQPEQIIKVRGAETPKEQPQSNAPEVFLYSGQEKYGPGETLARAKKYKLHITPHMSGLLSIFYHEANEPTEDLVKEVTVFKGKAFVFPKNENEGISFTGDVPFANFQVKLSKDSKTKNWYYVFGFTKNKR